MDIDMKSIAATAMMQALDQGKRDELVKSALLHLMTPQGTGFGRQVSPLESAFQETIRNVAQDIVREQIKSDPTIRSRLETSVQQAFAKFFDGEKLADLMVSRLWELFEHRSH